MARTILDQELRDIDAQIVQLGERVDCALEDALQALRDNDMILCQRVIAADALTDRLRHAIEQRAFRLLTMQQPLGGKDLRFLSSIFSIVGDLERSGDGAKGIAQMLIQISALGGQSLDVLMQDASARVTDSMMMTLHESTLLEGLLGLGQEAHRVLHGTIQAFLMRDAGSARYIWEEDDVVDVRYHQVRHDLMTLLSGLHAIPALEKDGSIMQRVTYYLWMAHKLERMSDHCSNVCERIVFVVEGERTLTHSKEV